MLRRVVLLDTSFVIALENRGDPHHQRAKELDRELLAQDALSVLHWGILLEIGDGYARLSRRAKADELLDRFLNEERYQVVALTPSLVEEGVEIYRRHSDKEWGLTDCVSFALMHTDKLHEALTADQHFRQAGFTPLLLEQPGD